MGLYDNTRVLGDGTKHAALLVTEMMHEDLECINPRDFTHDEVIENAKAEVKRQFEETRYGIDGLTYEAKAENPRKENPDHYDNNWEVLGFIEKQGLGFTEGNIVKYICRHKKKNGLEDLKKARNYLDKLIKDY